MSAARPPGRSPGPEPRSGYRLSDAERDEAISALAEAYAEGRLDVEEFQQRMDTAGRARFAADLDPLFEDLPRGPMQPSRVPAPRQREQRGMQARPHGRGMPWVLVPVLLVVLVAVAAPVWILLPFLFIVARRAHHRALRRGWEPRGQQCLHRGRGW